MGSFTPPTVEGSFSSVTPAPLQANTNREEEQASGGASVEIKHRKQRPNRSHTAEAGVCCVFVSPGSSFKNVKVSCFFTDSLSMGCVAERKRPISRTMEPVL